MMNDNDYRHLPEGLRFIVNQLGISKAMALLEDHQGQVVNLPEHPTKQHQVVKIWGLPLVKTWVERYGIGSYQIPMMSKLLVIERNREIYNVLQSGASTKQALVLQYGLTRQQISNIEQVQGEREKSEKTLSHAKALQENQLELFGFQQ
jgi:hypothetical protein